MMFEYRCRVINVVDGDTIDVEIDLGFRVTLGQRVRLWGIDAAELHGASSADGRSAKEFLALLVLGHSLTIRTIKNKDDKYGRLLGILFHPGSPVSVNQRMLDVGKAKPYRTTLTPDGFLQLDEALT